MLSLTITRLLWATASYWHPSQAMRAPLGSLQTALPHESGLSYCIVERNQPSNIHVLFRVIGLAEALAAILTQINRICALASEAGSVISSRLIASVAFGGGVATPPVSPAVRARRAHGVGDSDM